MKLHNPVQNEAILSNVGSVGEFRIRNSAKAFNILSSGLYANKIRAIIRELSCNAVDSHVAAGKQDTPFDVHIPNTLEPWFSIRDYGTGLSHEQVTNIYTTYFESTKTDSNDYIGALGLGSKSPFSYTDNFTVTAIKDGRRGIYTAFINDQGVPSIALMHEEASTDPAGVEVKFSVNDRYDFDKFQKEAYIVYVYFSLRPVIHGVKDFKFKDPEYLDKDIIPGVHYTGANNRSIAVMGNIAYPIDVPQADTALGTLRNMLNCGLVIEFNIGELDFQASREGLSYIPSTINAIKNKLEALNNQLVQHIKKEADVIGNLWDRAAYLEGRFGQELYRQAVIKYVNDIKFPLAHQQVSYALLQTFSLSIDELESKYNIKIRAFEKTKHKDKTINLKFESTFDKSGANFIHAWKIRPVKSTYFVITDTKRGAYERAKNHWRSKAQDQYAEHVYVIEPADKKRTMHVGKFLKDIYSPPSTNVFNASQLIEKAKNGSTGNWGKASILELQERERSRRTSEYVWASAGTADEFDSSKTYYYIEMNHWTPVGVPMSDMGEFYCALRRSGIYIGDVFGVRKNDIESVRTQSNWVELNGYVKKKLESVTNVNLMGLVKAGIDFKTVFKYINGVSTDSPYYKLYAEFKDVESADTHAQVYVEQLLKAYNIVFNKVDPTELIQQYREKISELYKRYPLIKQLNYYADSKDVADYINMVDKTKGI